MARRQPRRRTRPPKPADGPRTVLVVDDSATSLASTAELLRRAGYTALTARNGFDGIRSLYRDAPDALICDVVMPELNGYQLCRLVKNDPTVAHIPVILLTSLGEERDRFWGSQAGADRYIVKKNAATELPPALAEALSATPTTAHYSGALYYVTQHELDDQAIKSRVGFLLDKLLFEQTLVNQARRLAGLIHHRDRFVNEFMTLVANLIHFDQAGLLIKHPVVSDFYVDSAAPVSQTTVRRLLEMAVRDSQDMRLFERHRLSFLRAGAVATQPAPEIDEDAPSCAQLICRIESEGHYLGTLVLERRDAARFTADTQAVIDLLARTVAMSVQLMLLYEENLWLSMTDPLTQLHNRRYFLEHFESQFRQFHRYHVPAALLFIDIDNFKLLNDTYGHNVGDLVLVQLADNLRASVRTVDLVARLGGEEFVILLPQTTAERAQILAERLRAQVAAFQFGPTTEPLSMTVSIGISEFDAQMRSAQELLDRADQAMLEGKRRGKNRVVLAPPPAPPAPAGRG